MPGKALPGRGAGTRPSAARPSPETDAALPAQLEPRAASPVGPSAVTVKMLPGLGGCLGLPGGASTTDNCLASRKDNFTKTGGKGPTQETASWKEEGVEAKVIYLLLFLTRTGRLGRSELPQVRGASSAPRAT